MVSTLMVVVLLGQSSVGADKLTLGSPSEALRLSSRWLKSAKSSAATAR